jgi:UDP-N-acetylglucosamine 2-epimerase (non-hydrolysing)
MVLLHVVGARPNFMKVAPVFRALMKVPGIRQILVHTGQHYDRNMSQVFFQELDLPTPHVNLGVGSGTQSWQTAQIMMRLEPVVLEQRPDWVVVYGDVNSTLGAALVCAKLGVKLAHVEAGLRSFDRSMPEEVNRVLTDQVADLLFTPSEDAETNLLREGIGREKIHFVGNVMIDTLMRLLPRVEENHTLEKLSLEPGGFALVTLHRPSNVDEEKSLKSILQTLEKISDHVPIVFPIHPRTRERLAPLGLVAANGRLRLTEPLGYLDFLALQKNARLVITDSGGIQEETTFLGIPCLTVRENTERPVTVQKGTNVLVGKDMARLLRKTLAVLEGRFKKGAVPDLWDGRAAERIAGIILDHSG